MREPSVCNVKLMLSRIVEAAVARVHKAEREREAAEKLHVPHVPFEVGLASAKEEERAAVRARNRHRAEHGC